MIWTGQRAVTQLDQKKRERETRLNKVRHNNISEFTVQLQHSLYISHSQRSKVVYVEHLLAIEDFLIPNFI